MKRKHSEFLTIIGLAAFLVGPSTAVAQIDLRTAGNFGVLAGASVNSTGATIINNGDVGVSPGSAVNGFPPGIVNGGVIRRTDAVSAQAQLDLALAYDAVAGAVCPAANNLTGQDLGGKILPPGVYCFNVAAFQITAPPLTLDFQGDPNATFLFQIGTTLINRVGAQVVLINNAGNLCPPNVFWQVGSSATIEVGSTFVGNILTLLDISMKTGASLSGRALARTAGAVTIDSTTVSVCAPAIVCPVITVNPPPPLPNGVVGTPYNQVVTAIPPLPLSLTGTLPAGLTFNPATGAITGTPTTVGTFNFTITATDPANGCTGSRAYTIVIACPVITLGPLPPGIFGVPFSQTISTTGGTAPFTFSVLAGGALPNGLTLNINTGAITGTPATPGLFNFTIQARDANGCLGSRVFAVAIAAAPGAPTLDFVGLTVLMLLLAGAGLFVMNRFSI